MNILSTEDMRQAESALAKVPIHPNYKLKVPSQRQFQTLTRFQGTVFPLATPQLQTAVQKIITLTNNMRSLSQAHPNAVFHLLTLALTNILYHEKYSGRGEGQDSSYLLETIKCSLYSQDLQFKQIKNVDFPLQTPQLKLLVHQFFSFMQEHSQTIKANRINAAEWIFQHNPLLLATFALFFRLILAKLGLDQAQDYRKPINTEEAIMNLIQYFDLHYRSLGQLILFYEDGLFMTLIDKEIILGQYYENQRQKQSQNQQLQIKSSVKLNKIESLFVNTNDHTSMIAPKKKGIVDSDVKLFNFMLENSNQDESELVFTQKQKEADMETPNFIDNTEQFHFTRKKKTSDFKPQEVRNQFQRLIMDESQEFVQEEEIALTPYLGGEKQFTFTANLNHKQLTTTQQIDSPIDELNEAESPRLLSQKQVARNNALSSNSIQTNEQKNGNSYSNGFSSMSHKKEMIISTFTDTQNRVGKKEVSSDSCQSWAEITQCICRKAKLKRNIMASKVVEVAFIPEQSKNRKNYLSNVTSPKFLNSYRPLFQKNAKEDENQSKYDYKQSCVKKEDKNYLDRKPAFLKNLKRNKAQSTLEQDFSKSAVNQSKKYEQGMTKQTSHERLRFGKFNSCLQEVEAAEDKYSRSTPKQYQGKSIKTISHLGNLQRTKEKPQEIATYRSGMVKPWQTNSNFIQKVPEYLQVNKIKSSQMSNPNTALSSTSPLRFFAPVQIIAPAVYLNSNTSNSNNIVFKLDDLKAKASANPQVKHQEAKTHRVFKGTNSQPHVKMQAQVGKGQKEMGQYKKFF